jgi:tRNA1Val (adenine37-N6)-methyltransferase
VLTAKNSFLIPEIQFYLEKINQNMAKNNYFKFKQFTVVQEKSAMKVGVDGVLLGAWASGKNPLRILDVGTGTGLIALMMSQRFPASKIDAVEIDEAACREAQFNFGQSPWNERLQLFYVPFQQFSEKAGEKYDLIVSNPPFFENSVKVKNAPRELARNSENLSVGELFSGVSLLLAEQGSVAVVFPYQRFDELIAVASETGLFLNRLLKIKPTPEKTFHRILAEFSRNERFISEQELMIESMRHHDYTNAYRELTRDFYLQF